VAPRACVRVYARVLVPPNLYIHTYITQYNRNSDPDANNKDNKNKVLRVPLTSNP